MPSDFVSLVGDSHAANDRLAQFNWTSRAVQWADRVGPRLATAIRQRAPVGPGVHGGRLRDATRYERQTRIGTVRLEFHARQVPYVPYVLRGTRAHEIRARAALVLHWKTPGGVSRFARVVHHPGTHPNRYPIRAYRLMAGDVRDSFRRAFEP